MGYVYQQDDLFLQGFQALRPGEGETAARCPLVAAAGTARPGGGGGKPGSRVSAELTATPPPRPSRGREHIPAAALDTWRPQAQSCPVSPGLVAELGVGGGALRRQTGPITHHMQWPRYSS